MRCHGCYGSGKMMGGGFVSKRCDVCEGSGFIDIDKDESALKSVLAEPITEKEPKVQYKKSRRRLVRE